MAAEARAQRQQDVLLEIEADIENSYPNKTLETIIGFILLLKYIIKHPWEHFLYQPYEKFNNATQYSVVHNVLN
jgi:hypothetical protein